MSSTTAVLERLEPAIECPAGFTAGGLRCGIKPSGADDLAMILCAPAADGAAVFTRNQVQAAPVVLSRQRIAQSGGRVRALIINSGCANAATGDEGMVRAARVMDRLAQQLSCPPDQVLMNSTGVIGEQLPAELILTTLPSLVDSCSADGLSRAARAIMTTDTRVKMAQRVIEDRGRTCRVAGIAKGAGMIHPNMATMIAVIVTDAALTPGGLQRSLTNAVDRSFNRMTIDGDTSTNDSVFMLASGVAGEFDEGDLEAAVVGVARDLSEQIVRDGEGATKLIRVRVTQADSARAALVVARTIASSLLVRTSVSGGDPNWGRILAAAGRAGVAFDLSRLSLTVNGLAMFDRGAPVATPRELLEAAYSCDEVIFELALGQGSAGDEYLTCDLTEAYVRLNASYTT